MSKTQFKQNVDIKIVLFNELSTKNIHDINTSSTSCVNSLQGRFVNLKLVKCDLIYNGNETNYIIQNIVRNNRIQLRIQN